jgi:hypothetical protein
MPEKIIIIFITLIILLQIILNNYNSIAMENSRSTTIPLKNPNHKNIEKFKANPSRAFTENYGQLENKDVFFYDQRGSVWFTAEGVFFELREEIKSQESGVPGRESYKYFDPMSKFRPPEPISYRRVVLMQEFVGGNKVRPVGRERLCWKSNFFYGNDSEKWCTNVPNYAEVWFENLYDGIDLKYYTNKNGLKYDIIVHPGADPRQIRIRYKGTKGLKIDEFGNMIIKTQLHDITDGGLFIYQDHEVSRDPIKGRFVIHNKEEYGFEILENYREQEVLVIDPNVRLEYSTFIGGNSWDGGTDIAVDLVGNAFVAGGTLSADFPITPGAYQGSINGNYDVFVLKLNQNGSSIIYSTFIGGSSQDTGHSIAINTIGEAFLTGITESVNFPFSPNAYDKTYHGYFDVFVLKLNSDGSMLNYSTYIGGSAAEQGFDIAVDKIGNAFVTGEANSSDFPTTTNAFNNSVIGSYDVFVLKLNHNGSSIIYSTFVGGINNDHGISIALDSTRNAFVTGFSSSSDFPTTLNGYNRIYQGDGDVFVVKLNHNGSNLNYSTFIGGSDHEQGLEIAIDSTGSALVTGWTNSSDLPVTPGCYDNIYNGISDVFVFKLNIYGSSLVYSTFIGGDSWDIGRGIAVDSLGNVFVTGYTMSSNFPTTSDAYNRSYNNLSDVFIFELDQNGSTILYSTYLGGSSNDLAENIIVDAKGDIYIIGDSDSPDFPTTPGAYNRTNLGGFDIFSFKFSFPKIINITSLSLIKDKNLTTMVYSRLGPYTFRINITDTKLVTDLSDVSVILDPVGTNIRLHWDSQTGQFSKISDPYNFLAIESSSKAINNSIDKWTIIFNVTFNWTFPSGNSIDVHVVANSFQLPTVWFNSSNLFKVENNLIFIGTLSVTDQNNRSIKNNSLIPGGENLNWTGLTIVYKNTTNIYPVSDEFDVIIWDEDGNYWLDSPEPGQSMNITTITPNKTTYSFYYTINLTGIPPECDKTNREFTIRIDADNVTFSNPWPNEDAWQKSSEVYTGITITDHGGGFVDNTSIMHSISEDNDTTWSDWKTTEFDGEDESITAHDFIAFDDGDDNFIKWCAKDNLGNGPAESKPYRILVDTKPVFFSNPVPLPTQESLTGEVEVGITISDNTSGVNSSTIKYSISTDASNYWSSWKSVDGYQNEKSIDVKQNLTFPNGTDNRIRWRAYDVAGNGPAYSDEYVINVDIPTPPVIPEIKLISPANNSKLLTTSVELSWEIIENYHPGIVFDIKLRTQNPPQNIIKQNYTGTELSIDDLENGQSYYWTVIPRLNNINGTCISGIWSFTVNMPLPKAILKTPENNSEITTILPTFIWSLDYDGTETVTYDVYFGTNKDPQLEYEKSTTTYFAIDTALQDNTTYYWKIVPWIGGFEGFSSEIWSFSVKLKDEQIPEFGIKLDLNPNPLEIKPGEVKFVSAIVTNLGEYKDNFTVIIGDRNNTKLTIENYRQDTLEIEPGKNKEFLIMVSIKEGTVPGFENITIIAKSNLAEKYNMDVKDIQVLTIKILEKDIQEGKEQGQPISIFYFSILFIIVILIIISIIIVILVRKKSSKKDSGVEDIQNIPHETQIENITSLEPEPTVEPLPVGTQQQDETLEE